MILAMVLALGIGVSLGLLGGGGSILTLPVLVYVLGMEAKQAIATSLLVVGITSAAAVIPHARAGRVNVRIGLAFGAASMGGAFAGGRVAHFLPSAALLLAFALMMLVTGLAMLRGRATNVAQEGARPWGRIIVVGIAIGLLTGVIGAGGGFVIVPALALLCGLPMTHAVATSLLVIALNSLAGFAGSVANVTFDLRTAAFMTGASVVGSVAGAFAAGRIMNPRTAHSQLMGGMIWGVGSALHEFTEIDRREARYVNDNLAEYLIPVNADVGQVDVILVPEVDDETSPSGAKGIGELANVGTAAAVANAVCHATGKRIRDLPFTIDKLIGVRK